MIELGPLAKVVLILKKLRAPFKSSGTTRNALHDLLENEKAKYDRGPRESSSDDVCTCCPCPDCTGQYNAK